MKRILVYQIGSIGDTVVTIPALRAIRRHFGGASEIVLLYERSRESVVTPADLLSGSKEVDRFISYESNVRPVRVPFVYGTLWNLLRKERFSAVVYLAPSERPMMSVARDRWFFRSCGIPAQVGFHAFPPSELYPMDNEGHRLPVLQETHWRLERIRRDGIKVSETVDLSIPLLEFSSDDIEKVRNWLWSNRRYVDRPLVAICPGTKQSANVWPLDRFEEIGKRLIAIGRVELLVVGGASEREAGERLVASWGSGINGAGQLSLKHSAIALSHCVLMVGVDTGTTHLAAAVGTRCVAIYGGHEHRGRWDPLGQGHILLRAKVPCEGCLLRDCPVQGHPCMQGIGVGEVWEAIQCLLLEVNEPDSGT